MIAYGGVPSVYPVKYSLGALRASVVDFLAYLNYQKDLRMQSDDDLCLCFHVTKRKVANYLRLEKPKRVGQLADCYGAGTGCGWCRPYLQKMFNAAQLGNLAEAELPGAEDYAQNRANTFVQVVEHHLREQLRSTRRDLLQYNYEPASHCFRLLWALLHVISGYGGIVSSERALVER